MLINNYLFFCFSIHSLSKSSDSRITGIPHAAFIEFEYSTSPYLPIAPSIFNCLSSAYIDLYPPYKSIVGTCLLVVELPYSDLLIKINCVSSDIVKFLIVTLYPFRYTLNWSGLTKVGLSSKATIFYDSILT